MMEMAKVTSARTSYDSRLPNHTVRGVVGELRVRCPEEGCDEVLQLQNLDIHRRQCVTKTTTCPGGCGRKLLNKEKVTHNCVEYLTEENKQLREEIRKKDEELALLRQQLRTMEQAFQQEGMDIDINQSIIITYTRPFKIYIYLYDKNLPTTSLGRAASPAPLAAGTSGEAGFRFQGLPKMEFRPKRSDWKGDWMNGEAKSNVVEAGGLRWKVTVWEPRVSFWVSGWTRFLLHAEGATGAPSPWTVTSQSLTLKVLRKGGDGGAPVTHRLEGATFSSEKGVVGMIPRWSWSGLTDPRNGFVDRQGTVHVEVSFEGAAMSPSPPPQRPTVWEAEATLQLRNVTSSPREVYDSIFSPSVHPGGESEWSLEVDWTISLLSADGGGWNQEKKEDGEEVNRGRPLTYGLSILHASIGRFLTGDSATAVNSANGPPDLELNMAPLPFESPGPISAPFIALSKAPQCS
ncbi:unnamed protein product [Cyprideis torosa]|uniref:Uncharacterized protein n=1 Tax=Cyprideis torosa TaxID=163714 RepID=A0A7R8WH19_9CRUS|nr:unnamed protein product [Cyprideis torosa]CAG0896024.1 unnamed protein product [Cyprideis torosa]